ncbi:MAG: sugar phosphate isomerase/epimerase [Deltaproteobacteria bacterium]|nr:sugar phosphate isomerase/epimerase [Deltaproteobacteria bacterium]
MNVKLAVCNIFRDMEKLGQFASDYGFSGIDWSFDMEQIPESPAEESKFVKALSALLPLEIRFHCPFYQIDLGHNDPEEAKAAGVLFRRIIRLVAKAGGEFLTLHIGLGHNSTRPLSWDATADNLRRIVQFGAEHRVKVCLENLAWGWTSKPNLFEKLIRRSGAAVTFDIGHAHACESIRSQQYAIEDFITPHAGRVLNAHIYHTENSGLGHLPPGQLEDFEDRLDLLLRVGCKWWVIEIKEPDGLLKTKKLVDKYLDRLRSTDMLNEISIESSPAFSQKVN